MPSAILTAYCLCAACCGATGEPTASGRAPIVGVSIAAPRSVPFGTWVRVTTPDGRTMTRRVDDRTAPRFEGRWDVLVSRHADAREFGKRHATVRIISEARR